MKKTSKTFWTFLILICLSNQAFGDAAVFIQKDTPAPYSGYLFTEAAGKDLKLKLVDLEYFKALSTSLQSQVDLYSKIEVKYQEKITIVEEQNDKLAKSVYSERNMNNWERAGYFVLGVAATVFAAFAVKQVVK